MVALTSRMEGAPILPREMVSLTLEYLHLEMRRYFVDSPDFSTFPAICFWSLGAKGLLLRGFHLHPLIIDFSRLDSLEALKEESIDGALLGRSVTNRSDIHVEVDSDNLYMCTLTPASAWYSELRSRSFAIAHLHAMAHGPMVDSLHRFFFTKAVKLHVEELDAEWRELEKATAGIALAIQKPPSRVLSVAKSIARAIGRLPRLLSNALFSARRS